LNVIPNNKIEIYLIIFRKKKKKDKSKNKDEKINVEENQEKINHGTLTIIQFVDCSMYEII